MNTTFGVMFRRERPPEELQPFARFVQTAGLDELWIVEDCFWAAGLSAVTAALAATETLTVGLGIAPAVARNPAITAMEMAGIARMFPGRFVAGLGHGVADWMRQIGALPASQLAALDESIDAIRRLLKGYFYFLTFTVAVFKNGFARRKLIDIQIIAFFSIK